MRMPQAAMLADGRRLHLHDGPIDLVIEAFGTGTAVHAAYRAAGKRFTGLLDELVAELDVLRTPADAVSAGIIPPNSSSPARRGRGTGRRAGEGSGFHSLAPSTMDAAKLAQSAQAYLRRMDPLTCEAGDDEGVSNARRAGPSEQSALPAEPSAPRSNLSGIVARRMQAAVLPFAAECFITPMAAVAGAVAEEILQAMLLAAPLARAYVNNGGDIAFHLAPGESFVLGLIDRPDHPNLFARAAISGRDSARGIATSGWRGRSFSLGIADAVSVLAATAAQADAAATVIANAVDLPGHPAIARAPANSIKPDNDLGERLVTRAVGPLSPHAISQAIAAGLARAENLRARGLIDAAAIHLQGETRVVVPDAAPASGISSIISASSLEREFAHA